MVQNQAALYSQILYSNLNFFKVDVRAKLAKAAGLIAEQIASKQHTDKEQAISIVIANTLQSKLGLSLALELVKQNFIINCYLLCRSSQLIEPLAQELWLELKALDTSNLVTFNDVAAKQITSSQCFVMCFGNDYRPSKRSKEVVKRITHFNQKLIDLDYPGIGYSAAVNYSIDFAKTENAQVLEAGLTTSVPYAGPGEVEALAQPRTTSYKRDNGKLLALLASPQVKIKQSLELAAEDYCANVSYLYFSGTENNINDLSLAQLDSLVSGVDAILVDVVTGFTAQAIVEKLITLYPAKTWVCVDPEFNLKLVPNGSIIVHSGLRDTTSVEPNLFLLQNASHPYLRGKHFYTGDLTKLLSPHWGAQIESVISYAAVFATRNHPWLAGAAALFMAGVQRE